MRLNFDLVTGFSLVPLQLFSLAGFLVALGAIGLVGFQIIHRLVRGEAAEGVFGSPLEAFEIFTAGLMLLGIGLLGEYIGRIYQEVLRRPRFRITAVLERLEAPESALSAPRASESRSDRLARVE